MSDQFMNHYSRLSDPRARASVKSVHIFDHTNTLKQFLKDAIFLFFIKYQFIIYSVKKDKDHTHYRIFV